MCTSAYPAYAHDLYLSVSCHVHLRHCSFALFIGLIIAAELISLIWINSSQFNVNSLSIEEPDQVSNTLVLGKELFTNVSIQFFVHSIVL